MRQKIWDKNILNMAENDHHKCLRTRKIYFSQFLSIILYLEFKQKIIYLNSLIYLKDICFDVYDKQKTNIRNVENINK